MLEAMSGASTCSHELSDCCRQFAFWGPVSASDHEADRQMQRLAHTQPGGAWTAEWPCAVSSRSPALDNHC